MSLTISVGRAFHLHIGPMDYGYLYGIHLSVGKRQWSWVRATEKRRKWESTHG